MLPNFSANKADEHLIQCMLNMGYQSDKEGICWGLSLMAAQAIVTQSVPFFNARMALIHRLPASFFRKETFEQSLKVMIDEAEKNNDLEMKALLLSIKPFFDGIEVHHLANEDELASLFEEGHRPTFQDPQHTLPLTSPVDLDALGGMVEVKKFTYFFEAKDFRNFFQQLRAFLDAVPADFQTPIAFTVGSYDHGITLGYDPIKKDWIFFNDETDENAKSNLNTPNNNGIAIQIIPNSASMDEEAFRKTLFSFCPEPGSDHNQLSLSMAINFYLPGIYSEYYKNAINNWLKDKGFNTVSHIQAMGVDALGSSLLCMVAQIGDLEKLPMLGDANPFVTTPKGDTPLSLAMQGEHDEIIDFIKQLQVERIKDASDNAKTRLSAKMKKGKCEGIEEESQFLERMSEISKKLLTLNISDAEDDFKAGDMRKLIFYAFNKLGTRPTKEIWDTFKTDMLTLAKSNNGVKPTMFSHEPISAQVIKIITDEDAERAMAPTRKKTKLA